MIEALNKCQTETETTINSDKRIKDKNWQY
jgi:hypothetical protein